MGDAESDREGRKQVTCLRDGRPTLGADAGNGRPAAEYGSDRDERRGQPKAPDERLISSYAHA